MKSFLFALLLVFTLCLAPNHATALAPAPAVGDVVAIDGELFEIIDLTQTMDDGALAMEGLFVSLEGASFIVAIML